MDIFALQTHVSLKLNSCHTHFAVKSLLPLTKL